MRISDIQPQYFPRLHYLARMLASDVFVIRDDVQFVRSHKYPDGTRGVSYQAHTPIKTPKGVHLMTVSLQKGSALPIHRTHVSYDQPWVRKHVNAIKTHYRTAPNLGTLLPEIELLLRCRFSTIAELDIATLCWALCHVLGEAPRIPADLSIEHVNELLRTRRATRLQRIVRGSAHFGPGSRESSTASERIAAMCRDLGADEYMGGRTALQAYLDTEPFRRSGVELKVQTWSCPAYRQQHTGEAGFIANLSILDLLMNEPAEKILSILGAPEVAPRALGEATRPPATRLHTPAPT